MPGSSVCNSNESGLNLLLSNTFSPVSSLTVEASSTICCKFSFVWSTTSADWTTPSVWVATLISSAAFILRLANGDNLPCLKLSIKSIIQAPAFSSVYILKSLPTKPLTIFLIPLADLFLKSCKSKEKSSLIKRSCTDLVYSSLYFISCSSKLLFSSYKRSPLISSKLLTLFKASSWTSLLFLLTKLCNLFV